MHCAVRIGRPGLPKFLAVVYVCVCVCSVSRPPPSPHPGELIPDDLEVDKHKQPLLESLPVNSCLGYQCVVAQSH